jgi:hypothetical protein
MYGLISGMSVFIQTLLGRSRFIRWALSPFLLLFAIFLPQNIPAWTFMAWVVVIYIELMCVSLLASFWLPPRAGFLAFRFFAGMLALACAAVLISAVRQGDYLPFTMILVFLVLGVQSLLFAVFGRSPLKQSDDVPSTARARLVSNTPFPELSPIDEVPLLITINTWGFKLYGKSDYDAETASYMTTHYFVALLIPLCPVARYRVVSEDGHSYRFLGKGKLRGIDWVHMVAFFAIVFYMIARSLA